MVSKLKLLRSALSCSIGCLFSGIRLRQFSKSVIVRFHFWILNLEEVPRG